VTFKQLIGQEAAAEHSEPAHIASHAPPVLVIVDRVASVDLGGGAPHPHIGDQLGQRMGCRRAAQADAGQQRVGCGEGEAAVVAAGDDDQIADVDALPVEVEAEGLGVVRRGRGGSLRPRRGR
jgi:hypothetical protein